MRYSLFFIFFLISCNSQDLNSSQPNSILKTVIPSIEGQQIKQQAIEEQAIKKTSVIDSLSFRTAEKAVWQIKNYLTFERNEFIFNYNSENAPLPTAIDIQTTTKTILLSKGTGFFISSPKYVVSSFHVIYSQLNKHTEIIASKKIENKVFFNKLKLLKVSSIYDLALLESEKPMEHYLSIDNKSISSQNNSFFLIAYPNSSFIRTPLTYSKSYFDNSLISFTRKVFLENANGSSGGAIINSKGNIVAVNQAGNDLLTTGISSEVLNNFLDNDNNDNRDCSHLSTEDCIEKEWLFLQKLSDRGDKMAQYILSTGLNYSQWENKKQVLQNLIENKNVLTEKEIKLIKFFNEVKKKPENIEKIKEKLEEYKMALTNYNQSIKSFNTQTKTNKAL